jgi:hypothetical protein
MLAELLKSVAQSADRIADWMTSDDPALHQQAHEEQLKLRRMIDGVPTDDAAEAESAWLQAQRDIMARTVAARFKKELTSPYGDPAAFIERFQDLNRHTGALEQDEEQELVTSLLRTLTEISGRH